MPTRSPAQKADQPVVTECPGHAQGVVDMSGYDRSLRAQKHSGDYDLSSGEFARVLLGFFAAIVVIALVAAWAVSA